MDRGISQTEHPLFARVAGSALLLMALLAGFANFFVFESLIVQEDAAETARNIIGNEMLFRSGIIAFVLVAILDVVVAWALYVYFRPVHQQLSLLAALLRLVYTAVLLVAVSNHLNVLQVLGTGDYDTTPGTEQLHVQLMLAINTFTNQWLVGLMIFGLHLLVLGYLMILSGHMARVIGILLMAACAGYLIDSSAQILLPNYADYETLILVVVAVPGVLGELSLAFWLLLRGVRRPARQPATQLSAS